MTPTLRHLAALFAILNVHSAVSQVLPNSFPNSYPGQPQGNFSTEWQSCMYALLSNLVCDSTGIMYSDFQVTETLPNITFDVGRSFAGNIPTSRDGHPNDTLFFWGFEKQNGSLTAAANDSNNEPWGIWLNGG